MENIDFIAGDEDSEYDDDGNKIEKPNKNNKTSSNKNKYLSLNPVLLLLAPPVPVKSLFDNTLPSRINSLLLLLLLLGAEEGFNT